MLVSGGGGGGAGGAAVDDEDEEDEEDVEDVEVVGVGTFTTVLAALDLRAVMTLFVPQSTPVPKNVRITFSYSVPDVLVRLRFAGSSLVRSMIASDMLENVTKSVRRTLGCVLFATCHIWQFLCMCAVAQPAKDGRK